MRQVITDEIRVGRIWYPVKTLGYGSRLGVWMQGCLKDCPGCISPEMKDPQKGELRSVSELVRFAALHKPDGFTVSGGEPFDQPESLLALVRGFLPISDDILVFTGYTLEELHEMQSEAVEEVLASIAVLVDGRYMEKDNDGRGLRGSSNQIIYIRKYPERYEDANDRQRTLQCVLLQDRLWMIGIPPDGEA